MKKRTHKIKYNNRIKFATWWNSPSELKYRMKNQSVWLPQFLARLFEIRQNGNHRLLMCNSTVFYSHQFPFSLISSFLFFGLIIQLNSTKRSLNFQYTNFQFPSDARNNDQIWLFWVFMSRTKWNETIKLSEVFFRVR